MRLTQFTDYGLRVLLYVGLKGEKATADEISRRFRMSRNHVAKVIHKLGKLGWIETSKGRGGGIYLAPGTEKLTVADVVLKLEPDFTLVECFDREHNQCPIAGHCKLEILLQEARSGFLAHLRQTKLSDLFERSGSDRRLKTLKIT